MKTIYYYGVDNNKGGLENFAKNLITSVTSIDTNIKYKIITCYKDVAFKEYFESIGCDIIILPMWKKHPLKYYNELRKVFANGDEGSTIHLNICSYRNFFLFKACKESKLKTIIVGHYTKANSLLSFIIHKLNRFFFRNFGIKVTNSNDVTNFMFTKNAKPLFIYNGIDTKKFEYNHVYREDIRKQLNINSKQIAIGQIGRISPDKNQSFSVDLVYKLHKIDSNYHLYLIGNEQYELVRKKIEKYNASKYIHILGPKDNIHKYYSAFDISLLPSINEGLSLALLENASNGIQTFLSTAVPKLNINCQSLHYVSLDNLNDWIRLICKINPNIKRTNNLLNTHYDINACAKEYLKIY